MALITFHGSLQFFRPRGAPGTVELSFERAPSLKDVIESLGIPHPEVDLVLSGGRALSLEARPAPNDRIDVFGLDRPADLATLPGLMPAPPDPRRFVLDGHLGRLARYLRILGFDSWYERGARDDALARVSAEEDRILLTRDRGLLKRSIVRLGYLPRADDPRIQLSEVSERYALAPLARPFTRCVKCNGLLRPVDRSDVLERLANQPRTLRYFDSFSECPDCGSIYWPGSHYERMSAMLTAVLGASRSMHNEGMRENRHEAPARTEGQG
jgi:hypothetical protein